MERRLYRLSLGRAFYSILAIDHGLTVGFGDVVDTKEVVKTISACLSYISGVVLTYGIARHTAQDFSTPIILQCFGAPSGHARVKIASLDQALRLDAAAVSVQIDLNHEEISQHVREVAKFVAEAHNMNMPVLFMTSGFAADSVEGICKAIRVSHELGADLIKVPCHASTLKDSAQVDELSSILRSAPPTLLAGGPANPQIVSEVTLARSIGFSGYCIGRSIFQAEKPGEVASSLLDAFRS